MIFSMKELKLFRYLPQLFLNINCKKCYSTSQPSSSNALPKNPVFPTKPTAAGEVNLIKAVWDEWSKFDVLM